MTQKDPLTNEWVLRYDSSTGSKQKSVEDWNKNLRVIASVSNVQDFWGVYQNIKTAGSLEYGSNYHFFKKGIMPAWEDVANKTGGKWTYLINHEKSRIEEYDQAYLYTLLALIGEQFEGGDHISGAVGSVRKRELRLSIWIKTTDKDICMKIGKQLKEILAIPDAKKIAFQVHGQNDNMYTL